MSNYYFEVTKAKSKFIQVVLKLDFFPNKYKILKWKILKVVKITWNSVVTSPSWLETVLLLTSIEFYWQ